MYIHASSKLDRGALDWLRDQAHVIPPGDFVKGAVVAVVEIVDVVTEPEAAAFSPWFFGPYGFVLANIRPFRTPVPERVASAWAEHRRTCAAGSHARCVRPSSVEHDQRVRATPELLASTGVQ